MKATSVVDSARRRLVVGASAFAASQLVACATCRREEFPSLMGINPVAALTGVDARKVGETGPFIDSHAHFFNARDVQVRGFLEGPIAHAMADDRVADLVRAIAPIAERLSYLAPSPAAEMGMLQQMPEGLARMSVSDSAKVLDDALQERREIRLRALQQELNQDARFRALYQKIIGLAARKSVEEISLEHLRETVNRGSGFEEPKQPSIELRGSRADVDAALSVGGVIRFVTHMLSPRADNLRSFIKAYSTGSRDVPLAGAIGALVEFNHWLGEPCKASQMLDQVRLHEQLVRLSGGFLLPVVGYNPASDLRNRGSSLKVVEDALTKHGFIGVKLYPPNGFLPYGNGTGECDLPRDRPSWWDGNALDVRLGLLYQLCDRLGVPVIAHANESMGEDDEHDRLAGVCGWSTLDAAQGVRISSLSINAGHLGGDGADGNNWTAQFTSLMKNATRVRVFGDLSYWDRLGNSQDAVERLRAALRTTFPSGESGLDRVMYGSDWLMLSREDGYERFASTVMQVLRSLNLSSVEIGRVFGGNALACYGLRKTDLNFRRFTSHFGDEVMNRAVWAQA